MRSVIIPLLFIAVVSCGYKEHLNQFLHEFEELAKDNIYLEHVTNFTVLSAMKIYVRIELQRNTFHAVLQPHYDLFHEKLVVRSQESHGYVQGSINIDEFLEGHLVDEPNSRVLIHLKDNIVSGTIQTADREKYFIEPSHRHVKEPHDFHMISYKLSDVKFNFTQPEKDGGHFCGHDSHKDQDGFSEEDFDFMLPKYEKPADHGKDGIEYSRKKRDSVKKNKCPLALIGDYIFYKEVNDEEEANAINYMIGLIQQIDPLYLQQSLDPDNSDEFKGYGFNIAHVEVIKTPNSDLDDKDSYLYYTEETKDQPGVSSLLKNFAYGDWSDYCLAHLFTNYDFDGGVLGLAYVAAASTSRVGGICTKTYTDGTGRRKHLNVGLTTSINYGRSLLTSELVFVTGHEFGHNWGSSHDSDTSAECAPSGNRFMMYPAAVDGSQTNNAFFSPCSKQAINDVLVSKSDICFAATSTAMCGNGVVEDGEDCDQGITESICCNQCSFTSNAVCEPSNDECCTDTCAFADSSVTCLETFSDRADSIHCYEDHKCSGYSTECIRGAMVADDTECYDNGRCRNGVCMETCAAHDKLPCLCDTDETICYQCCKASANATCELFVEEGETESKTLANGKLCGNGMCLDGICKISAQDVQEKFWEVIDQLDINMLARWFKNNIVFTIIIFTSIFWIPISIFVDWLDDKYDLGVLDDVLGSSEGERKGNTMMLQERRSDGSKPQSNLYPKLGGTDI